MASCLRVEVAFRTAGMAFFANIKADSLIIYALVNCRYLIRWG
jgi:hypothetical protein